MTDIHSGELVTLADCSESTITIETDLNHLL
jgi:hypothetical protein